MLCCMEIKQNVRRLRQRGSKQYHKIILRRYILYYGTYYIVCDFVACMIILLSYYNCSTSRYFTRSSSLSMQAANPWRYQYLGFQLYHILDGLTPCEYKSIKDSAPFSPQKGSVNHLASKHVDAELKFYQA